MGKIQLSVGENNEGEFVIHLTQGLNKIEIDVETAELIGEIANEFKDLIMSGS